MYVKEADMKTQQLMVSYRGHELLGLSRRHQLHPGPLHGGGNHRHVAGSLQRLNHPGTAEK